MLRIFRIIACALVVSAALAQPVPSDAERQAQRYGLEYAELMGRALEGDDAARGFFLLSCGVFDGAGSEKYGGDLYSILTRYGEHRFLEVLTSVDEIVEARVCRSLAHDQGWGFEGDSWQDFKERFPLVAERIERWKGKAD